MKVLRVLFFFLLFTVLEYGTWIAFPAVTPGLGMGVSAAYAQSAPLDKLEEKVEDIKQAIFTIATVLVLVALVFAGVRFLQGDPNSWRYLVYVFISVLIVYGGTEIVEWLKA